MKKYFNVLLHIGFWLGYLFFLAIIMFTISQSQGIDNSEVDYYFWFGFGTLIVPPVFSFYTHYYYLFPRFLQKRKLFLSIIVGLAICIVAVSLGFLSIMLASEEAANCVRLGYPYSVVFTMLISAILGVVALVLRGFLKWYEELKVKEELMEKTHRMELALVKSQLDPHFLFNTINNIDVLICKRPEEASNYLNKLSDIMRFMLYETKSEQIPLAKELEYIEKFIELQKIRTANDNYVQYEVSGTATQKMIAPMVFIPFIENAFKHATNKKVDHAVDINIHINGESILFKCFNHFDPFKVQQETNGYNGLGDELIRRRLNLLYPEKHILTVDHQQSQYGVELTILNGTV